MSRPVKVGDFWYTELMVSRAAQIEPIGSYLLALANANAERLGLKLGKSKLKQRPLNDDAIMLRIVAEVIALPDMMDPEYFRTH